MSETKWTPGPWSVNWARTGAEIFAHDGKWLMTMERPPSQIHANAHLIAAAPELYEALEAMLAGWRYAMTFIARQCDLDGVGWKNAENKAEAALAKARGEQ